VYPLYGREQVSASCEKGRKQHIHGVNDNTTTNRSRILRGGDDDAANYVEDYCWGKAFVRDAYALSRQ
jgi:hypothetical protein